ncbi:hypothetical protein TYRP_012563 [Tyrophagus putrescentiae]|nr:hypothetical protein TYRP_012563 [Tyrophagus putrescentiae]
MLHQSGEFNRVLERTEPGKQMSGALEHQWWISVGADRGGCWQLSGTVSSELITDYEGRLPTAKPIEDCCRGTGIPSNEGV